MKKYQNLEEITKEGSKFFDKKGKQLNLSLVDSVRVPIFEFNIGLKIKGLPKYLYEIIPPTANKVYIDYNHQFLEQIGHADEQGSPNSTSYLHVYFYKTKNKSEY